VFAYFPLIYLPASAGLFVWLALKLRESSRVAAEYWAKETQASASSAVPVRNLPTTDN
jgi:hypothetical protein